MADLRERLFEKGWSEEEVNKALEIIQSEEKIKKHAKFRQQISPILYWSVLLVAVIVNLFASVVLIPFLITIKDKFILFFMIGVIGIVFGLFFNLLFKELEILDYKHYVIAGIFIPVFALINVYIVVNISNTLDKVLNLSIQQDPIKVSFIYVAAFVLPYALVSIYNFFASRQSGQTS